MSPGTVARLALAGTRTDTARVALTAVSAGLACLAALAASTVAAIPDGEAPHYTNALLVEHDLRQGVGTTLVLLMIPVLMLAGQCTRLGIPARDQRLASIRLAGAGPRQVMVVGLAETAAAAGLGAVGGLVTYLVGRLLAHHPDTAGRLPVPTDVLPPWWVLAATPVAVTGLAACAAAVLLRRVTVTPFAVLRATRARPPRRWPVPLLLAAGTATTAGILTADLADLAPAGLGLGVNALTLGILVSLLGVLLSTGWLAYLAGALLHRFGTGPVALLAGRRMMANPWTGSRSLAALLACVLIANTVTGFRTWIASALAVPDSGYIVENTGFYLRALVLTDLAVAVAAVLAAAGLLVALVESIGSQRRTNITLAAAGVPRSILARATAVQTMIPAVLGVLLATVMSLGLIRWTSGAVEITPPPQNCTTLLPCSPLAPTFQPVPMPYTELIFVGIIAIFAVAFTVTASLPFLRPNTTEELRTA